MGKDRGDERNRRREGKGQREEGRRRKRIGKREEGETVKGWGEKESRWKMVKSEEKGQGGKEGEEGHGREERAKKHL